MAEPTQIDALANENRTFPPPEHFKQEALVVDTHLYDEANQDDEAFWARQASELVSWDQEWTQILDWQLPYAMWFVGGKLNVSANCLDRHVAAGHGDKVAIHWEG
ncbi:MAG: acetyl-coenzyme A synthetase N-terminal domain-containing protein, partial [Actinomycetota bacterium]